MPEQTLPAVDFTVKPDPEGEVRDALRKAERPTRYDLEPVDPNAAPLVPPSRFESLDQNSRVKRWDRENRSEFFDMLRGREDFNLGEFLSLGTKVIIGRAWDNTAPDAAPTTPSRDPLDPNYDPLRRP